MIAPIRNTPGVYVQEISTLPPSVAEVTTAIPAFIGYTVMGYVPGGDNVVKIRTLLEYETRFGTAQATPLTVTVNGSGVVSDIVPTPGSAGASNSANQLYYNLSLYFSNGGGPCYIVSIGNYTGAAPVARHFHDGLAALETEDEPTLILFPEAVNLTEVQYYALCVTALQQCEKLQDRFCILDVKEMGGLDASVETFRDMVVATPSQLKYGAAYYPYLNTAVLYKVDEKDEKLVTVETPSQVPFGPAGFSPNGIAVRYEGGVDPVPSVIIKEDSAADSSVTFATSADHTLTITRVAGTIGDNIVAAWSVWTGEKQGFALNASGTGKAVVAITGQTATPLDQPTGAVPFGPQTFTEKGIQVKYTGAAGDAPKVIIKGGGAAGSDPTLVVDLAAHMLTITRPAGTTGAKIAQKWTELTDEQRDGFEVTVDGDGSAEVATNGAQGATLTATFFYGPQIFTENGIEISYTGGSEDIPKVVIADGGASAPKPTFSLDAANRTLTITRPSSSTGKNIVEAWKELPSEERGGFRVEALNDGSGPVTAVNTPQALTRAPYATLDTYLSTNTTLYNLVKAALTQEWVTLPPSAAVAGVYASVDRTRGVWNSPANVGINAIVGPQRKISLDEQDGMNVDPMSGKSINAIRSFKGRGTLVFGARTLAGNDNEWRYINVRRLFNMIEMSIQQATAFAVFEANDATTWLKVKSMIESFLFSLWERGALAGPTPEAAFFVNVGLGKTMTTQDILEGRMIVKVGVAAVRPAEFIILVFSHKLQEA